MKQSMKLMQEHLIWNFGVTDLSLTQGVLEQQWYGKRIASAKDGKNSRLA